MLIFTFIFTLISIGRIHKFRKTGFQVSFFLPPILYISFYLCALAHADETGFVLARVLFLSVLCFTLLSFLSFKPYHLYVWHLSVLILG